MEFKNVEKFEQWLESNVKAEIFDIDVYLEEVINAVSNGNTRYELSSGESKSCKPEVYDLEVEVRYYDECENILTGDEVEDFDHTETVITF